MADASLFAILSLGFGLGLLHALDADHVVAVSTLASLRPGLRACLRFALRWSLGHGATLLMLGGVSVGLGLVIPDGFAAAAEVGVGAVLIALGAFVLRDLVRRGAHVHFHEHDHLPAHAHWHTHGRGEAHTVAHRHRHGAVLVGALHGAAGSAPLLALVPAISQGSPGAALVYLGAFSLGVLGSMLVFGGILGSVFVRLVRSARVWPLRLVTGGSACGSIALGTWLLATSL